MEEYHCGLESACDIPLQLAETSVVKGRMGRKEEEAASERRGV